MNYCHLIWTYSTIRASEFFSYSFVLYIVRHPWKEIEKSEMLAKFFPEPPVVAFRWPKSIKDTLVRAAVSRPSSTVGQCKPCGDKRCKCCLQLQHTQVFHSKTTGKEYKIFCNVNCKTPNVVYLLDCHVCGSQYVGESVQPFNKRMNGHLFRSIATRFFFLLLLVLLYITA